MTDEQFKQWRYAKALEIAALMKGPYPEPKSAETLNIMLYYDDLQNLIAQNMFGEGNPES